MKIFAFIVALICLAAPLSAQEHGGTLMIGDQKYEVGPMEKSRAQQVARIVKALGLTEEVTERGGAYYCTGEYCACIGHLDCYYMTRAGVCDTVQPKDWKCQTLPLSRVWACSCDSSFPPMDTSPINFLPN